MRHSLIGRSTLVTGSSAMSRPPLIARHRDALMGTPARSYGHKTSKPRSAATVSAISRRCLRYFEWGFVSSGLSRSIQLRV